jgi:hypothetical protein
MLTPKPTAKQRWQAALQKRNMQREEIRNSSFRNTPLSHATAIPATDMMVRRGTRLKALTGAQASATTRKSWQARKEKYGKKGRASKLTFHKTHKRIKS